MASTILVQCLTAVPIELSSQLGACYDVNTCVDGEECKSCSGLKFFSGCNFSAA